MRRSEFRLMGIILIMLCIFPSASVFSIDVKYNSMRFLRGDYIPPRLAYRSYSSYFNRNTTKYIHIEFSVDNLWKQSLHRFDAKAFVYFPSGRYMTAPSMKFLMPRGSGRRYYTLRIGYSRPGIWIPGRYKVRLYIEGQFVAQRFFTVSGNERKYGNSNNGSSSSGGSFPAPKQYGRTGSQHSIWQIYNNTPHTLYISYRHGSTTKYVVIAPNKIKSVRLQGGYYHIFGSLSKSSVKPFRNYIYIKPGYKYRNRFYIKYRNMPKSTPRKTKPYTI